MKRTRLLIGTLFTILGGTIYGGWVVWPAGAQGTGQTARVSVASDGSQANGHSHFPVLSEEGRYVAFQSHAANLVPGDTNGMGDIFVHDRQTGQTTRVSVASDGTQANLSSENIALSGDGRYVAFDSYANNLVPDDTNGTADIFVHDRQTGQTTRVSVASDGTQANRHSEFLALSDDGRYVAFSSLAGNLVSDDMNEMYDIFVHDRQMGHTTRVSVASDGSQASGNSFFPMLSGDGRYVAFWSEASNLVSGDTNGMEDIFVHDRQTGQTTRVSVASKGTQANGRSYIYNPKVLSGDGRYVAFWSEASNLVSGDTNGMEDVFVHDRQTGQTTRVSVASKGTQANGDSSRPALSGDGRYVAFDSYANNLVPDDTNGTEDIFVHDRQTGQTARVSVISDGTQANGNSSYPELSSDGRYVAFSSLADNLVSGDTNGRGDIFVHDRLARLTLVKSLGDDDLVEDFRFEGPTGVFTLTTQTAAYSRTFDLPAGTHTFRETPPANFALLGVTCIDAEKNDVTGEVVDFSAIEMRADVTLAPAADLTCTFLNDRAVSTQDHVYLPLIVKEPAVRK